MSEVIQMSPMADLTEGSLYSAIETLSVASNKRVPEWDTVLRVSIWNIKEAVKLAAWTGCEIRVERGYRDDEWSLTDPLNDREVHSDGA